MFGNATFIRIVVNDSEEHILAGYVIEAGGFFEEE